MQKWFLTIALVSVAVLFSQGGDFLIASLCPHVRSGLASCNIQVTKATASHEHMDHRQMASMETESTPENNADGNALDRPAEPCNHCAVHSRAAADPGSLRESETAKRSGHLKLPLTVSRFVSVPTSVVILPSARAHGPPGELTPRHILINIFRI